jgi:hypothetical protein
MAKGKHATALFEVIHASKQFGGKKDKGGVLRTPKWWFKSRLRENDPTSRAGVPSPVAQDQAVPAKAPEAAEPSDNAPEPAPVAQAAAADPTQLDEFGAPRPPAVTLTATAPALDVDLDSQRQRITFRFTYTSAIVTAFAVIVIVGLAYLVGARMSRGPAQAIGGPSTDQLRQGPARPDVMDVGTGAPGAAASTRAGNANQQQPSRPINNEPDDSISSVSAQPSRTGAQAPTRTETPKLPAPTEPGKRVAGLNYVIIQSYPDEASAKAAVDALKQYGVGATIERGLRGYTGWFAVVGVEPFARISGPEYTAYLQKIQQVSDKFASRKSFKAFDPRGYKWDRP